jgi:hypothetical protein
MAPLCLAIAQVAKHNQAKFRALANMGDILIKMNNLEEAVKVNKKYFYVAPATNENFDAAPAPVPSLLYSVQSTFLKQN